MDEKLEFSHACGVCGAEWRLENTNMAQVEMLMELIERTHTHTMEEAVAYIKAAEPWGADGYDD